MSWPPAAEAYAGKTRALALIILAQVFALSVWFAGAAALPGLAQSAELSRFAEAALTASVQAGFVIGALASAFCGLPDRMDARRLFAFGALAAALANLLALTSPPGGAAMIATRFIAGASLAFVYPVGMKLAASWARGDAGLLVGLLVGALTLGSATPFAFNLIPSGLDWRAPFALSAIAALIAGGLILFSAAGPGFNRAPRFDPGAALLAWKDKALRYANLGYLGHMWELYAMWAWIGAFCYAYWSARDGTVFAADLTAFSVVAIGALGCFAAGWAADRIGRTAVTMAAMAVSGACALTIGFLFGAPPIFVIALLLIWGVAIIADSAQFSAAIAELAPPERAGTLLTLQTALGFALTAIIVQALPYWIDLVGWRWGFAPLAIGPAFGVWAMGRLRARPEAVKMASGKR